MPRKTEGGGKILNNVDLVVTDPPYQFVNNVEPSWWWFIKEQKKQLVNEIRDNFGLDFDPTEMLETIRAWMKKFNWYFFTNRFTLPTSDPSYQGAVRIVAWL